MHRIALLSYKMYEEGQTSDAGKREKEFCGQRPHYTGHICSWGNMHELMAGHGGGVHGRSVSDSWLAKPAYHRDCWHHSQPACLLSQAILAAVHECCSIALSTGTV